MNEIVRAALTEGTRHVFALVSDLVEQRFGHRSVPDNILNAIAPILAEMAEAALNGELVDPVTGKVNAQVRMQFDARIVQTLGDLGLLESF